MSTEKKPVQYKFSDENETFAEETFMRFPVLDLDLTKRYTFADYLTWMDYRCTQKVPVHIFDGLEIDLKEVFEN